MDFELRKDAGMLIAEAKITEQDFAGFFQSAEIKHYINSHFEQALEWAQQKNS